MIYTEPPVNLPACWLNKTITMRKGKQLVGVKVKLSMINPECRCYKERIAYFCEHGGKLLQCNKTKLKGKEVMPHGKRKGEAKAEQQGKGRVRNAVARKTTRAGS